MLVAGWMVLHAYDANGWYNRNLGIIANIERQFLEPTDAKDIHCFFTRHRSSRLVEHLQIHAMLGVGFAVLTLAYHFSIRVWTGRHSPIENFEPQRLLPYVTAILVGVVVVAFRAHYLKTYQEFESKSPGIVVGDVTPDPFSPP